MAYVDAPFRCLMGCIVLLCISGFAAVAIWNAAPGALVLPEHCTMIGVGARTPTSPLASIRHRKRRLVP